MDCGHLLQMLRKAISEHTGEKERPWPKDVPTADYGGVNMSSSLPLLDAVKFLFPGEGIATDSPTNMEEYNQGLVCSLLSCHAAETCMAGSLCSFTRCFDL